MHSLAQNSSAPLQGSDGVRAVSRHLLLEATCRSGSDLWLQRVYRSGYGRRYRRTVPRDTPPVQGMRT